MVATHLAGQEDIQMYTATSLAYGGSSRLQGTLQQPLGGHVWAGRCSTGKGGAVVL